MSAQAQAILAGVALIILGVLTGCMVFVPVPQGNQQLVTFALGSLSGALTFAGGAKLAEKIGSAVNVESPQTQKELLP